MLNPWLTLPTESPFILHSDADLVASFNSSAKSEHRIVDDLLPEPVLGSFDADVVLLNLNPGFSDADYSVHARRSFVAALLKTIRGEPTQFPFYYLDPSEDGAGHRWWRQRLRPLIDATSNAAVAARVLCVELFPYHSYRFNHARLALPSQRFGFELVRRAIRRRAQILAMRGWRFWTSAVPELANYRQMAFLRSWQNVTVSERNCPDGFPELVRRINGKHGSA